MTDSPDAIRSERYDVVIVGGGSAGCVLASRLSEDAARSVLLIEAGPAYPPDGYPADLTDGNVIAVEPQRIWGYQSVPGQVGHFIPAYAGRVLGGGSAVNSGISQRGLPSDFARWVAHDLPHWSWDAVLDTYRTIEDAPHGEERWHGRGGSWPVRQFTPDQMATATRAFVEAAVGLGHRPNDDFNGGERGGVGGESVNIVDGVRVNTGMVYLTSEVRARPNLTVLPDTLVDRVLFDGLRARAVRLADGSEIGAEEIVLSAGTYGSPAILLRSGVGPSAHLQARDVAVVADLPVGERLCDHPLFAVMYLLKPDAGPEPLTGSGLLWTKSSEAEEGELDQQLVITVQPDVDAEGRPVRMLAIWAALVRPTSTGTLRLKNADPTTTPRIDWNLLGDDGDRKRLTELVKLARRIAAREPVASMIAQEVSPGPQVDTDVQLDGAIRAGLSTFYHGTSTVPMGGPGDGAAVVDGNARVRGLEGLRVVDASIFPEPISAPTNLTTIMVAERIAGWIAREDKGAGMAEPKQRDGP